jgi:hypothetical protein
MRFWRAFTRLAHISHQVATGSSKQVRESQEASANNGSAEKGALLKRASFAELPPRDLVRRDVGSWSVCDDREHQPRAVRGVAVDLLIGGAVRLRLGTRGVVACVWIAVKARKVG